MRACLVVVALAACSEEMPAPNVLDTDVIAFAAYQDTIVWSKADGDDLVIRRRGPSGSGEVWRRAIDPRVGYQELIAGPDGVVLAERDDTSCTRLTWIASDGRSEELPLPNCFGDVTLYDQFDGTLIVSGNQRIDLVTHAVSPWRDATSAPLLELVRGDDQDYALVLRAEGTDLISISRANPPVERTLATGVIGNNLFTSGDALYWFQSFPGDMPMRVFRAPVDRPASPEVWFESTQATQRIVTSPDRRRKLAWANGAVWLEDDIAPVLHRLEDGDQVTTFELGYMPGSLTAYRGQLLIPDVPGSTITRLVLQGVP